ncbi:translation elongation factor 2 [Atractiella rhizophila]|nr:translation elongation factor 2 [Atractiella rhizophila]
MDSYQVNPENIRNVCILAHVDHGKSSFADSLLASNGIISNRLVGNIRYLDSREDEQERGITMKSSSVSLKYRIIRKKADGEDIENYMINLIDTPGHVDFYSEVFSASRLCDGCLVLIDVVEGVCTQTITVLQQAYMSSLRPILVFNKLDRLITELKFTPNEAYHHLNKLLQQVNAVMGNFFQGDRMEKDTKWREERERRMAVGDEVLMEDGEDENFEETDDSSLYFDPTLGDVIFSSAIDGLAFSLSSFAKIYASKLKIPEQKLIKVFWGEWYLDAKNKKVVSGKALDKEAVKRKGKLKLMFVQFILENIWAVYDAVVINPSAEKVQKIATSLSIKVRPPDLRSFNKEPRPLLQSIFSQWLPLPPLTFQTIIDHVPPPTISQSIRLPKIIHHDLSGATAVPWKVTDEERDKLKPRNTIEQDLYGASKDGTFIAFVSKIVVIKSADLPQNQRKQLTADEMRERARRRREEELAASNDSTLAGSTAGDEELRETLLPGANGTISGPEENLIGFCRVFSGTLHKGDIVSCILPKYNVALPSDHPLNAPYISKTEITDIYRIMGRELLLLNEAVAGDVVGLGGLEGKILKSGTLMAGEVGNFVNLAVVDTQSAPIVRIAVEPKKLSEMNKLVEGLRLLNQVDPCVETFVQETGEHVLLGAGELHLERCLNDLRDRFAKIQITASAPIVPFRETAIRTAEMQPTKAPDGRRGTVVTTVHDGVLSFTIRAIPLPSPLLDFLQTHPKTIKGLLSEQRKTLEDDLDVSNRGGVTPEKELSSEEFWSELEKVAEQCGRDWKGIGDSIWAFGPKRIGANILVDRVSGGQKSLRKKLARLHSAPASRGETAMRNGSTLDLEEVQQGLESDATNDAPLSLRDLDDAFDSAFQIATGKGPLCHEPVYGMSFFVEKVEMKPFDHSKLNRHQLMGGLISSTQEAFRNSMLDWSPRLALAMYSCDIQATTEVLGKVYGVVARRRGQIISEEMKDGTVLFTVRALIPVVESWGFAADIRKKTSGAASPQLVFHGFEILDLDPFWVPTTEEELEDLGEKSDRENVAKKYMDAVRKRKGLFVERRVVEHAEKQRTLKK